MSTDNERFGFTAQDVWHATLDGAKFAARVARESDYTGRLTVTVVKTGEVLLDREVTLAYGALFGPDVDDVHEWQTWVMDAVDAAFPPADSGGKFGV